MLRSWDDPRRGMLWAFAHAPGGAQILAAGCLDRPAAGARRDRGDAARAGSRPWRRGSVQF
eukprot:11200366-Lingulodinium_polyedra.AAC.1